MPSPHLFMRAGTAETNPLPNGDTCFTEDLRDFVGNTVVV